MTKMNRNASIKRIHDRKEPWDMLVIGGGATGVGVAMDAASRGLDVVLVEQSDFGKGTSSRSTKLVHGGVRYLQQGNITLVRDALRERTLLRRNAPHLVHDMPFLIPCESLWQRFYYGLGLKIYDLLAWSDNFGKSASVSAEQAGRDLPTLRRERHRGGVIYHDGQFDDTRLLINMAATATQHGACLINYAAATDLIKDTDRKATGAVLIDRENESEYSVHAKCIINAAGPFCDSIRQMDETRCEPMLAASQGVHIVLPRSFFPGNVALIVPKTSDGRVLFIIPWHDHVVVGTTDTPIETATLEPSAQEHEIQFLIDTTASYLERSPTRDDVQSVFVGIRPLVKGDKSARTASLSRDHVIRVSDSGLVTITGGKWTTVRKMAEDCVDRVVKLADLNAKPCVTKTLKLHGCTDDAPTDTVRSFYGSDLAAIATLESERPEWATLLCEESSIRASDVIWAVRNEMARTVEDVLARRTRVLFLNSRAAVAIAPVVARWMADELGYDESWCQSQVTVFGQTARHFQLSSG
ncbi:Aerobic glycerol-3-phosphate dehydrogenase [Rubripirellula tenax]|uniref:Glycerol-3-phosphate dehydrogenase n=1 Tax=Rubripirellula tenax TaxID=2528015 RepID=A0A5C6FBA2_9BACT|nr:glycerol-3-phosphate dehydrogenase/oxidase [Rubripirellula tenax]TWU56859.1 Aerobic glycerol-3-phosphate dehydrogenase [Rubripirellula tenax]